MSTLPAQRERRLWSDVFDSFAGWPLWGGARDMFGGQAMPLEDETTDGGRYEIRAEIPGIDPASDLDITVHGGRLTIRAERAEKTGSKRRSEFSYGSFVRMVPLQAAADNDDIKASYDKGILTISVGMSHRRPAEKHIQVQADNQSD